MRSNSRRLNRLGFPPLLAQEFLQHADALVHVLLFQQKRRQESQHGVLGAVKEHTLSQGLFHDGTGRNIKLQALNQAPASRFLGGGERRVLYFWHTVGNRMLTLASNMFTNLNLTDMETCYKMFRREVVQSITIESRRFGIEPEITAKVARRGYRIYEVPISYYGRTYEEGKKIGWKDGFQALWCLLKYNLK